MPKIKQVERAAVIQPRGSDQGAVAAFFAAKSEEVIRITHPNDLFFRVSFNDTGHCCDRFVLGEVNPEQPQAGLFLSDLPPQRPDSKRIANHLRGRRVLCM